MRVGATSRRNTSAILATAAGVVVLVSATLAWLGWKVLAQEEALERQQARDALEDSADRVVSGFLRRAEEIRTTLGRGSLPSASPDGAVTVSFSSMGTESIQPPNSLLYVPVAPDHDTAPEAFSEVELIEFRHSQLESATRELTALMRHRDPLIAAEARLRLARVYYNSGRIDAALATYATLRDERRISPWIDLPYGFVSRFQRALLLAANKRAGAAQEAQSLLGELESGRWPITKEAYAFHDERLRALIANSPPLPYVRLAVAAAVHAAWTEWRMNSAPTYAKYAATSDPRPAMAVISATPDRLLVSIYSERALRELFTASNVRNQAATVSLVLRDEQGRKIFEEGLASGAKTSRELLKAGLPWRLDVVEGSTTSHGFTAQRRWSVIVALGAVGVLVCLACYAIARGVLREAAAGRLQSDFVSAVSHEFRTPLTTLRQLTELLADGRILEEQRRRRYFQVLQSETARLHQLVEDLLDFGRMEAGRQSYQLEALDLSELVRHSVDEYSSQGGLNGHRIETTLTSGRLVVAADREALRRVVRNLLENAVKYSPGAAVVWVETRGDGREAVLRVRDAGLGIPAEERSRIFDKFVRGEAAKQSCIAGTGIGLAMVREIVTSHHGRVDVTSEPGNGSTFSVQLPLVTEARDDAL